MTNVNKTGSYKTVAQSSNTEQSQDHRLCIGEIKHLWYSQPLTTS